MTLDELIAALEKAEIPCRSLDLDILNAVRPAGKPEWKWLDGGRNDYIQMMLYELGATGNPVCSIDPFTSSIDAALTLVPDNENGPFAWNVAFSYNGGPYSASVLMADESIKPVEHLGVHQHSPAIALCIAALKARKESQ